MWAIQPGPAAMRRALPSGRSYTQKIQALGPIAYYPQAEPSGTTIVDESGNGRNGTYVGVTLGQPGIGDGRTAAGYDGATSYGNIYSASLAGAWNGAEGTIVAWQRSSGGSSRCILRLQADASNLVQLFSTGTANEVQFRYTAGGTVKQILDSSNVFGSLFSIALTWSKSNDQMRAYAKGVQVGATQTGLGTWAGALATTLCCIGAASTTPTLSWLGSQAHTAIFNRALSAAEIASLAVVP